jgi:hypothetical protein
VARTPPHRPHPNTHHGHYRWHAIDQAVETTIDLPPVESYTDVDYEQQTRDPERIRGEDVGFWALITLALIVVSFGAGVFIWPAVQDLVRR